jgi:hypothetical protein
MFAPATLWLTRPCKYYHKLGAIGSKNRRVIPSRVRKRLWEGDLWGFAGMRLRARERDCFGSGHAIESATHPPGAVYGSRSRKGRNGIVLLLDEAQLVHDERDRHGEHPLSLLLAPIVALQRQELPLALVLCGLPTLTGNLQKARSYSERLFRGEEIDSLPTSTGSARA